MSRMYSKVIWLITERKSCAIWAAGRFFSRSVAVVATYVYDSTAGMTSTDGSWSVRQPALLAASRPPQPACGTSSGNSVPASTSSK
jgi:hypothetical protein